MKTTPKQYAQALFDATADKQPQEIDAIIGRFAGRLRQDGQVKRLHAIIAAFTDLWNRSHGIVEARVASRDRLDAAILADVRQYVAQRYQAQQVILVERIDPLITGGIVIQVGDEVIDASIATQLKKLKKNLIGASQSQS